MILSPYFVGSFALIANIAYFGSSYAAGYVSFCVVSLILVVVHVTEFTAASSSSHASRICNSSQLVDSLRVGLRKSVPVPSSLAFASWRSIWKPPCHFSNTNIIVMNNHGSGSADTFPPSVAAGTSPSSTVPVTHFCFLVHGYKGTSKDLSYLQSAILHQASNALSSSGLYNPGQDPQTQNTPAKIVIHNSVCNEQKTDDGIELGGNRLLQEFLSVIRSEVQKNDRKNIHWKHADNVSTGSDPSHPPQDITHDVTLSIVGNSLGGIYSRYAIAKLAAMASHPSTNNDTRNSSKTNTASFLIDDGAIRIHFNVFISTATPHLGISGHTWLKIPRAVEVPIANTLGQTGRDIFLITDIIKNMCLSPSYLYPLANFRKRIAYANAFHTDFVVPTETAAFLNRNSTYLHHSFSDDDQERDVTTDPMEDRQDREQTKNTTDDMNELSLSEGDDEYSDHPKLSKLVVATLHTLPSQITNHPILSDRTTLPTPTATNRNHRFSHFFSSSVDDENDGTETTRTLSQTELTNGSVDDDLLLRMSKELDSLGWSKVFVDVRREIPIRVPVPNMEKISRKLKGRFLRVGHENRKSIASLFSSSSLFYATNQRLFRSGMKSIDDQNIEYQTIREGTEKVEAVESLRQGKGGPWESREVARALSLPDEIMSFPIGHNMMVAFSRNTWSSFVNKGGRPLMDKLAKELVAELLSWRVQDEGSQIST